MGWNKKWTCPKAGPNMNDLLSGPLCIPPGFDSDFAAFLAFSFAANSRLTFRAKASVSTP